MAKITKTVCELYKIRELPHHGWADITIDAAEHHGRIQIASDWGNWSYFWSHCGGPFKELLPSLEIGYVAGKFGCGRWFDEDKTLESYRKDVIRYRKNGTLDRHDAKQLYREISYLEGNSRESHFCTALERDAPALMKFFEYAPNLCYGIDPMFKNFWRDCWPVFLDTIRAETSAQQRELLTTGGEQ